MTDDRMTAARAALELRLPYQKVRQMIMTGELRGGADQIDGSRRVHWWVTQDSVTRHTQLKGE